ncbi:MAG: hypothetical protein ACKOW0_01550 [Schleiferiaceae bacterium]
MWRAAALLLACVGVAGCGPQSAADGPRKQGREKRAPDALAPPPSKALSFRQGDFDGACLNSFVDAGGRKWLDIFHSTDGKALQYKFIISEGPGALATFDRINARATRVDEYNTQLSAKPFAVSFDGARVPVAAIALLGDARRDAEWTLEFYVDRSGIPPAALTRSKGVALLLDGEDLYRATFNLSDAERRQWLSCLEASRPLAQQYLRP